MTGYGKASFADEEVFYLLEIHSVNRKNLDISIFLPREMFALDIEIRKWIGEHVKRGQVTLKLSKDTQHDTADFYIPNLSVLKSFKQSWDKLGEELGFSKGQISLEFLIDQLEKLPRSQKKELDVFAPKLKKAFEETMAAFLDMKRKEGFALHQEIVKYLEIIKRELASIGDYSKEVLDEYRTKLETRLKEFDLFNEEVKDRIAREVVLYADKSDLTEEIERLTAHVKSFEEKIQNASISGESIGKTLDFIVLEMNREANTIASKSQHLQITNIALTIKSEIEKIREQIQNIE
jgi:uncharacterized protein (TIGR00255 family)